jgi:hypothetical protein
VVLTWTRMTGVEGQLAAVISAKLRLASFMRRKSLRPALPLHSGAATSSKDTRGEQGRRYWRAGEDGCCRHTHWFATALGHGARANHGGPVADTGMFGGYHVIVAGVHDDLSRCAARHRVMCGQVGRSPTMQCFRSHNRMAHPVGSGKVGQLLVGTSRRHCKGFSIVERKGRGGGGRSLLGFLFWGFRLRSQSR